MAAEANGIDCSPCELSGACGFESFHLEMMGNDASTFPLNLWQPFNQPEIYDSEMPVAVTVTDAYVSPVSFSQSCQCDEEVTGIVRTLSRADMSNDIIQTLRMGLSLAERLLTCPICYDVSKPPRVTVQNVLLIGHLMFEVTSGYRKYLQWLDEHCAQLSTRSDTETVYLDSGLGMPSGLDLQIGADKFRDLVVHAIRKADVTRLLELGEKFAQRQHDRHRVGHEACQGNGVSCRKKENSFDHDPLDICPEDPVGRKLVPCFRIVDEVRAMIQQVADAV
ncbi:hypothetical protein N7492_007498 [Penicillium capsulatum]|uniref:Uncharacterized protein n=1 Tax=Penicillium capsulatum TaxID=69766 RepID=A0A9W9LM49_9EURO|nr:hypothetical protein N7492_007498 [Penicillium capsulatum]KAJ6117332.1 hypothetical protein N7512_007057 [Penicillium capsulatum]